MGGEEEEKRRRRESPYNLRRQQTAQAIVRPTSPAENQDVRSQGDGHQSYVRNEEIRERWPSRNQNLRENFRDNLRENIGENIQQQQSEYRPGQYVYGTNNPIYNSSYVIKPPDRPSPASMYSKELVQLEKTYRMRTSSQARGTTSISNSRYSTRNATEWDFVRMRFIWPPRSCYRGKHKFNTMQTAPK